MRAGLDADELTAVVSRLARPIKQAYPRIRYLFMESVAIDADA